MNNDQQSDSEQPTESTNEWNEQSTDTNEVQAPPQESNPFDVPQEQTESTNFSENVSAPVEQVVEPEQAPQPVVVPEQPVVQAPQPFAQPVPGYGQPMPVAPVPAVNPGQTLGIVSIVLGVLALWVVGLPLAIVSMVKSSKANAPKTLGVVGLVLNILSAVVVTAIIIMSILIALPALQENASEQAAKSDSQSTTSTTGELISLDTDYMPTSGGVTFVVPASIPGWDTKTVDSDGVNEFVKTDSSAKFMTYQGVLAGYTGTDRAVTTQAMGEYMTSLEATPVPGTDATVSFSVMSDGKLLEFATKQITAMSDSEKLKGIVAVRMYDGHELAVIYMATEDTFSLTEWASLTSELQINDGVL